MNYYEILEVEKTATQEQIKQSYKRLAKIHHPDKGGDKEVFQKIQDAYEVLSDKQKRNEYDNPNPQFNVFGNSFFEGYNPFNINMNSIFKNTSRKNNNHYHVLNISLYDIYHGIKKNLNIKHEIKCNKCNKKCEVCKGSGQVTRIMQIGPMQMIQEQPCLNCNSHGITRININCEECDNKGVLLKENIITIMFFKLIEYYVYMF